MNDISGTKVNKYLWLIGFLYMHKIHSMANYEDRFPSQNGVNPALEGSINCNLITLYLIGVRLCTRELLPILYIDLLWTKYMSVSQDCSFFLVKNEQMLESSLYN